MKYFYIGAIIAFITGCGLIDVRVNVSQSSILDRGDGTEDTYDGVDASNTEEEETEIETTADFIPQ